MDNDEQTGDDGLTAGERAEAAADAAGTKPGEAAAGATETDATATVAAAAEPDAAAEKIDPTAVLAEAAARIGKGVDALVAAQQQAKAETTPAAVARDFDAERVALKAQYEKGEIDQDQYEDARESLLEQRAEFKAEQRMTETLRKQREEDANAVWKRDVDRFRADPQNAPLYNSTARNAAFNQIVQEVARENPHGTNDQWLTEARKRTFTEFKIADAGGTSAESAIAKAATARRIAAGERPSPSIADAPAAGAGDSQIPDWMVALDKLPISDHEDALARLPADKLEQYLSTAPGGLKDNPRAA